MIKVEHLFKVSLKEDEKKRTFESIRLAETTLKAVFICPKCGAEIEWKESKNKVFKAECCGVIFTAAPCLYSITGKYK